MASVSCKDVIRCDIWDDMQVQGAIESLKIVTGHLAAWNLPKYVHVTVEPFLRPHADYYSGAAFQVCYSPSSMAVNLPGCVVSVALDVAFLIMAFCGAGQCCTSDDRSVLSDSCG